MKDAGLAHMGVGRAAGKGKAEDAARMAISSPLLETSINGAKGVLLYFVGSSDLGLDEISTAANMVHDAAHPDANIIWGVTLDDSMNDELKVTVIATNFENEDTPGISLPPWHAAEAAPAEAKPEEPQQPAEEKPEEEAPAANKDDDDDDWSALVRIFQR